MDIEEVIHKYTGHDVLWGDLGAAHTHPLGVHLAHALERAAYAVDQVDTDLAATAGFIGSTLETVRRTLGAAPGEPAPGLNPLGELQSAGPRLDALVAARADRITHLRLTTAMWRKFTALAATSDLAHALTEAGFAPITPAHASTRAAYGRRDGDREVTVSLDPFGEPGVEVSLCHAGVVAWTVTAGRGTPAHVVAATACAAWPRHPPTPQRADPTRPPGTDPPRVGLAHGTALHGNRQAAPCRHHVRR
jgi:hypothetical protein